MTGKMFGLLLFALAATLVWNSPATANEQNTVASERPNVIIILVDDLGYGDIGSYGADGVSTPHIDRLAEAGTRFTDAYAISPVCTPSRAGLLTGRYPIRMGIHDVFHPESFTGLAATETTLAELLSSAGYTTGMFGKWHLGHHPQFMPLQHGFNEFYGYAYSNDMYPYYAFDGEEIAEWEVNQSTITQTLTEKSLAFIENNKAEPFFLYLAHVMPHIPIGATADFQGTSERGLYGDVIQELDASIGTIVDRLGELGLSERTIILFASDNGPWSWAEEHGGSSGPLRGAKRTTFEGGMRVPTIVSWPGVLPEGIVNSGVTTHLDWFPTFADLTGLDTGELNTLDGMSLSSSLFDGNDKDLRDRSFAYYYAGQIGAYRSGDWKLKLPTVALLPFVARMLFAGANDIVSETELYNLRDDIGETVDLSDKYPEKVRELEAELAEFQQNLGPLPAALDVGFIPLKVAPYYERPLRRALMYTLVFLLLVGSGIACVSYLVGKKRAR